MYYSKIQVIIMLYFLLLLDQAPVTKEKDKEPKKKWTVQIAKQWKKMQPGSSNMTTPSYPEGGSIGKTIKINKIVVLQTNNSLGSK